MNNFQFFRPNFSCDISEVRYLRNKFSKIAKRRAPSAAPSPKRRAPSSWGRRAPSAL